jgi:hypothetical protein
VVIADPRAPKAEFSLALKPPAQGGVDRLLEPYFQTNRIPAAKPVSDAVFLRRAYLDLWGILPSPAAQQRFFVDPRPNKRALLIDELLANNRNYAEHFISFWNDLLHNDEGVIYHGERETITPWLLKALEQNRPYNEFAERLLNPQGKEDPNGFIRGVTWRGTVNASQTPTMQAAQNSAQVFLGINLKCNSCHDSFISHWKLKEAYALASFFSEEPLEIVRCDAPTNERAQPGFLFPGLASISADAPLATRRAAAAQAFTHPSNGLFARTIVNRVWRLLFGQGLIEPVDEMENPSWHPELLDWLAADLVAHNYDLKHLLRTVMNSQAYQRPSSTNSKTFAGPLPRRLTAEQFADSVAAITGEWRVRIDNRPVPGMYAREWRFKASAMTRALGRPIRDGAVTTRLTESTTLQALELVNGAVLNTWLADGAKRLLDQVEAAPAPMWDSGLMRATNRIKVDVDLTGRKQLRLLVTDVDSYDPTRTFVGWGEPRFVTASGETVPVAGVTLKKFTLAKDNVAMNVIPAELGKEIVIPLTGAPTRFQATLVMDGVSNDSEISPAVRGFAFDEPANLRRLVAAQGDTPLPRPTAPRTAVALTDSLYRAALGRAPTPAEMKLAVGIVAPTNGKITREGIQDLLWMLLLSPEFQFIA